MADFRCLNPSYPSLYADPVANITIAKLYTHTVLGGGDIKNAIKKTSHKNSSPLIDTYLIVRLLTIIPIILSNPKMINAKPIAVLSNNSRISV